MTITTEIAFAMWRIEAELIVEKSIERFLLDRLSASYCIVHNLNLEHNHRVNLPFLELSCSECEFYGETRYHSLFIWDESKQRRVYTKQHLQKRPLQKRVLSQVKFFWQHTHTHFEITSFKLVKWITLVKVNGFWNWHTTLFSSINLKQLAGDSKWSET